MVNSSPSGSRGRLDPGARRHLAPGRRAGRWRAGAARV